MALEAATAPRALLAACLVLLVLGGGTGPSSVLRGAGAQAGGQCLPQLNRLLACRAYLVPGAPDPSADCCSALSAVSHECAGGGGCLYGCGCLVTRVGLWAAGWF
uniref:LIM1 protein n=1 Tax=Zea mays TaxID=4577 RepID=B6TCV5_MAIZE|nr:LIM1 protein precursor [Zea mays]